MTMSKKKKNKPNSCFKIVLILILSVIVALLASVAFIFINLQPISSNDEQFIFEVDKNTTFNTVFKQLEEQEIIKSAISAKLYYKFTSDENLVAGKFSLSENMSVSQIINTLSNEKFIINNDVQITFIEGEWVKHMADKFEETLNIDANELLTLWNDEEYIKTLMNDYLFLTDEIFNNDSRHLLEGYLMPNTYLFDENSTADQVTRKLLDQTNKIYTKYSNQIESSELSIHEIFTLASIVQYEASSMDDMESIAGVFYNRLEKDMMLQSSVTVCYALDIGEDDSWIDCEVNPNLDSPYNTYKYNGLPPGPILNFGEMAMEATLNPIESDYLYFMADVYGDGTVYYSKTYSQHQEYVNKYLR